MVAFLDHVMSTGGTFCPVRNFYVEWKTFEVETLPLIEGLFPVTSEDEDGLSTILADWKLLSKDLMHYRSVYCSPGRVGSMKFAKWYRNTKEFYRLLSVFRVYQHEEMRGVYPLFTMRGFLAAQVESLAGFLDRLVVGNVVSEKARERYEDWYCRRHYSQELVQKAKSRPSDNNPVCNPGIRMEYEAVRFHKGIRSGDCVFDGEDPIPDVNWPRAYVEWGCAVKVEDTSKSSIVVPSSMRDLLK